MTKPVSMQYDPRDTTFPVELGERFQHDGDEWRVTSSTETYCFANLVDDEETMRRQQDAYAENPTEPGTL